MDNFMNTESLWQVIRAGKVRSASSDFILPTNPVPLRLIILKHTKQMIMNHHCKAIHITSVILILSLFITSLHGCRTKTHAREKPNIIIVFTDDQGYADLGVQEILDDLKTPHIDSLAMNGVRMTSGYVTAPQCHPSRAGLMSGQYQQKLGIDHNGNRPMPLDVTLLPQRLKEAGYMTGMVGKWHLAPNYQMHDWIREEFPEYEKGTDIKLSFEKRLPYLPFKRGFDDMFYANRSPYYANFSLEGETIEPQWIRDDRFRVDVKSDAAVTFIERNHENPFFLYLAYVVPHVPLEATEEYLSRFPGDMPERRRYCLAMLSAVDDGVGRIMEKLRFHGIEDNTMIYFISDNGAPLKLHKEDITLEFRGGAWDGSLNDPWIGEKGMLSEGGIRVPFIVSWPAVLPRGKVYNEPVIALDVAATAMAAAGLPVPPELDGADLVPYLTGEEKGPPHQALYWRFWGQSAIRMGDWKFLKAGEKEFLFNLASDEHEKLNLIGQHPEKAGELREKLLLWADSFPEPGIPGEFLIKDQETGWYDYYFGD
jgi:arylsulfatase A-like enzyme